MNPNRSILFLTIASMGNSVAIILLAVAVVFG